ncbi:MAG: tRNA (adenosine(37)-N6)-threonylcarbamoyltransferase complex transferase subunit TsaD [Janthinobacterium lividum]
MPRFERLILGIESSCDETSAAVVAEGRTVLSNVVASQLVHADYGGVVPELASREHLRAIVPVVREAIRSAGIANYSELSAIAVTEGPGLAGALLVGITFAKALAFGAELPLIAVNHLEGHIQAVLLEAEQQFADASPLLAAVVSGGHSHLYLASRGDDDLWSYRNVGRTVDDAAGEAFDKVAKLLGLPYPGGPWMDAFAAYGDPQAVPFRFAQIKEKSHGRTPPRLLAMPAEQEKETRFDVSFSGIKTGVRRYVELQGMRERINEREAAMRSAGLHTAKSSDPAALAEALALMDGVTLNLIASFQHSVTGYLTRTIMNAAEHFGARAIAVSGGVAANRELRTKLVTAAKKANIPLAFPSLSLSTDNAAMIAAAAWPKLLNGRFADDTLEAAPGLRLG